MKILIKLLAAAVILGLFSVPVYAGVKIDGVIIDPGEGATSAATVYYQGSPPFSVYRSLDGTQWTTCAAGSSENYYTDNDLDNYYNYYFKVSDSTGSYAITAAYPPNNNVHGSFRLNSSLCAACHVTHSASGGYLLVQPTSVALCTTCHDGTQSKYDVRNGKVRLEDTYADTSGGPFGPLASSSPSPSAWLSPSSCLSSPSAPPPQAARGTARNSAAAAAGNGNFFMEYSPQGEPHRSGRSGDRSPRANRGSVSWPRPTDPGSG